MKHEAPPPRILAIDPTCRGFGFAVLEGPATLVDWDLRVTRRQSSALVARKVLDLLQRYEPHVLVVEDCNARGSRRGERARRFIEAACGLAKSRRVRVVRVTVSAVHEMFDDQRCTSKHDIATAITEQFPYLANRLPPERRAWMSEAERMAIFDATAFGLTYYFLNDATTRH